MILFSNVSPQEIHCSFPLNGMTVADTKIRIARKRTWNKIVSINNFATCLHKKKNTSSQNPPQHFYEYARAVG